MAAAESSAANMAAACAATNRRLTAMQTIVGMHRERRTAGYLYMPTLLHRNLSPALACRNSPVYEGRSYFAIINISLEFRPPPAGIQKSPFRTQNSFHGTKCESTFKA